MNQYPFINIHFDDTSKQPDEQLPLLLEVILRYDSLFQKGETSMASVCLRIGESRLYYVHDFSYFFAALDGLGDYVLGQNFTYSGKDYTFDPVDMSIILLLKELYGVDQIFNKTERRSAFLPNTIIEDKWIFLPDTYLEKLLKLLEHKPFKLDFQVKDFHDVLYIDYIQTTLPTFTFGLAPEESSYLLTFDFEIYKMTHSFSYALVNGYVTKLDVIAASSIKLLYSGLYANTSILILPEKQEHFISEVVPYIKQFATLSIEESLMSSIVEAPLVTEVYLDKKGTYIYATIFFHYDIYRIDPFHPSKPEGQPIIFRDHRKEDAILNCFSDFVIKSDGLYLFDEEGSYNFLTREIPYLLTRADVFYSEAFKTIQINPQPTIHSAIMYNESENFLDFSFEIDGVDKSELRHLFHAIKLKKSYYRMTNGSYIGINEEGLEGFTSMLERLHLNYSDFSKSSMKIPTYRAFLIDDFTKTLTNFKLKREASYKKLINSIHSPEEQEYVVPALLQPILRDYQVIGYKWLKTLSSFGFGGILADDMGLGKTLQTLALILSEYDEPSNRRPSLIITPTSLVYNWKEEITKFLPDLDVLIIDGAPANRDTLIATCANYAVVLTSYPLIRRDVDLYESIQFKYCILDEAQHIKNPKSQNARSVKQIHANSYFALTGTPIENHLTELWSIFDFVMPQLLFSHSKFQTVYEQPIVKDNSILALNQLKQTLRPFILRRMKSDVLTELPEKIETTVVTTLTEEQKKLYLAHLEEAKNAVKREIDNQTYGKNHFQILSMITRLRQICCHPSMFMDNYKGTSGKLDLLLELIDETIESNHRILLFSQYTSMLKIIEQELIAKQIQYVYLDGSLSTKERKDAIHQFNHGQMPIFLISLKAGGTGLNLTAADVVIHYDPWWNPAVEDQATDRAYRIGQLKNVQVFKLIAKGTIEEKIQILQQKKKSLSNSVIEAGENFITQLTIEDMKQLFELD